MFIRVVDETKQDDENIEIPVDGGADGSVSLSTLAAQFHGIQCLLSELCAAYIPLHFAVRVVDDKLYHPDGAWDPNTVYVPVYSKANSLDIKRKGFDEQHDETMIASTGQSKTQRLNGGEEINTSSAQDETDPNRRCVDLIVLGISYRSVDADVKKCFEAFGELVFCEIKRDGNGQSRGFGFVRYKNYDSQLAVINKRHFIDGRHVDVKIPDSKTSVHEPECAQKIFVTRLSDDMTPDDLRQYFSQYGPIKDVYIPKPARSFGFVTFYDSNIVRTLLGNHIINGCTVTVGLAEPKTKSSSMNIYPPTAFKRAKSNHTSLRTLTAYDTTPAYPYYHQQHYEQSPNPERMYSYFQPYNVSAAASPKQSFANPQPSYWHGTHEDDTGIWQ